MRCQYLFLFTWLGSYLVRSQHWGGFAQVLAGMFFPQTDYICILTYFWLHCIQSLKKTTEIL